MVRYHQRRRLFCAAVLSLGLLFAVTGTAFAHARVVSAIPGIGSTITRIPTKVTVTCAENLNPDPKLSNLTVYGPDGERVSQGNSTVSLVNPQEMAVTITPHNDGVYVVRWLTVSAEDNDAAEGAFAFFVKTNATARSTKQDTPVTVTTSTATTSERTDGMSLWIPALASMIALLVGLGGGFCFGRWTARTSSTVEPHQVVVGQRKHGGPTKWS